MASNPPFSVDPLEPIPPTDPDYIAKYHANNDRIVDEIIGVNNRLLQATGAAGETQYMEVFGTFHNANVASRLVFVEAVGDFRTITGFQATPDFTFLLVNKGDHTVLLAPEHSGSQAGNRILVHGGSSLTPASLVPGAQAVLAYDKQAQRWVAASNGWNRQPQQLLDIEGFTAFDVTLLGNGIPVLVINTSVASGSLRQLTGIRDAETAELELTLINELDPITDGILEIVGAATAPGDFLLPDGATVIEIPYHGQVKCVMRPVDQFWRIL